LAAVRDLVPFDDSTQDLDAVRATVRQYAAASITEVANFTVHDADIAIGRYDPATVYTNFTILNSGIFDTVRVTLRRDTQANSPVSLFFARVIGINASNVSATATAVLQKASLLPPGSDVLPFSIPKAEWDATSPENIWKVYGDNTLTDDSDAPILGNWGTLDIGGPINSTSDMSDQILNGLRQKDLDYLYLGSRISQNTYIDSRQSWSSNGDPGLSSGMRSAVEAVRGQTKLIPIYDSISARHWRLDADIMIGRRADTILLGTQPMAADARLRQDGRAADYSFSARSIRTNSCVSRCS
jgi:hypothetical protein